MMSLLVHDQGDIAAAQRKPEAHALPAAWLSCSVTPYLLPASMH
jgi:hypothetical protein